MSEPQFREIQLSGKQLVFLFMTSVVVAVGVFLLGVSVGRGVGADPDATRNPVEQVAVVEPPLDLPPPTELEPADLEYHDDLLEAPTPSAEPASEPAPVVEAGVAEAEETPAVPARAEAGEPPRAAAARTPPAQPAPSVAEGWFVQVGAYRSRENADRQAVQLTAKGYPAAVSSAQQLGRIEHTARKERFKGKNWF
jgi:cell division protein FtsN